MVFTYTDMLEQLNIGSAHPGGLAATKKAWQKMQVFPHEVVLDVGCGTGRTLGYLANETSSRLIGVDHHQKMIKKARKRLSGHPQVELALADLTDLPFDNDTIDCIFSESVTSFASYSAGLKEYHRVLREKGVLCLIEITATQPLTNQEIEAINQFYGTKSILTKSEWHHAIHEANFSILDSIPLPAAPDNDIEIDINPDTDQVYFEFLTNHYHLIDKMKDQLIGYLYFCQKKEYEGETDVD